MQGAGLDQVVSGLLRAATVRLVRLQGTPARGQAFSGSDLVCQSVSFVAGLLAGRLARAKASAGILAAMRLEVSAILLLLLHFIAARSTTSIDGGLVEVGPDRRIARKGRVVVGGQVEVANHVLAFELDVHRPGGEVHLALDLAGDDALLRRPPRLVAVAGLVVALVLQHHLLAGDANGPGAFGGVLGQAGIGVGDRYPQRRRRRLRRVKQTSGKAAMDLPLAALQEISMLLAYTSLAIRQPSPVDS